MSGIIGVSPNIRNGFIGKYPVGHVIQTYSNNTAFGTTSQLLATNTSDQDADGEGETITGVTVGNKLVAWVGGGYTEWYGTGGSNLYFYIVFSPNTGSDSTEAQTLRFYNRGTTTGDASRWAGPAMSQHYIVPSGVTSVEVLRKISSDSATVTVDWKSAGVGSRSFCVIQEIQQ